MFFNWDIDQNYAIESMSGAAHCEVYEAFNLIKKLKVGMTYNKKVNLVIFAGADYGSHLERIENIFSRRDKTKLMNYQKDSQHSTD
jgi:hypothetical protein